MTVETEWAGPAGSLFRSLSSEHRLRILHHLTAGEKSGAALAELVGIRPTHLAPHLARLQRDNLVSSRREERTLFYSLRSEDVPIILETVQKVFAPTP